METETRTIDRAVQHGLMLASTVKRSGITRPADLVIRVATSLVAGEVFPDGEKKYLASLVDDAATMVLHRAAMARLGITQRATTAPALLSDTTWAGTLAQAGVEDFLLSIGAISAASAIMARANQFRIGPGSTLTPAGITPGAISGGFVEEGKPIPVVAMTVTGAPLEPKKMGVISTLSRELAKRSNAETLIRNALQENAALTFDAALFTTAAATAAAPAGLLNGATDLSTTLVTISGATSEEAAGLILAGLAASVAPVALGDIMFAAGPGTAVRLQLLLGSRTPFPILSTTGLAEGTIAAIAPRALSFAVDPVPDITAASEALLHMSTTPAEIVTAAGATASPVRSMFQTAVIAIRLLTGVTWSKRATAAVAYVTGAPL